MAYRLPPLNSLRLFEAAGRHLSFKQAAEELCVTPSAVSHGIQTLEDWLGVALFVRGNRSIALTAAGRAYLPQVREALSRLASASESVPGRRTARGGRLHVSVATSFGLRWLIPRLPRFNARHPDVEVMLDTSRGAAELPGDGIDLAIRRGTGEWRRMDAVCLAVEDLVPVCAPDVAQRIHDAGDLARTSLLHVVGLDEDWDAWAALAGLDGLDTARGQRFDTIHMALEAAAQGLGVAVGRLPLASADIAAGRLVPVLGPPRPGRAGYWLLADPLALTRPHVAAFRRWIIGELAAQRAA